MKVRIIGGPVILESPKVFVMGADVSYATDYVVTFNRPLYLYSEFDHILAYQTPMPHRTPHLLYPLPDPSMS